MHKNILHQSKFFFVTTILLFMIVACEPKLDIANSPESLATSTAQPTASNNILVTDTPISKLELPAYTLNTKLPDSPAQMLLYKQVVPAGLPDDNSLAALMSQLKITGTDRKSVV